MATTGSDERSKGANQEGPHGGNPSFKSDPSGGNPTANDVSDSTTPATDPGGNGGGGYGYSGWGSGSGDTGPTELQKNAALSLGPITAWNAETARGKAENARDAYDVANLGTQKNAAYQRDTAERKAGAEWCSRLLKEQSVYDMLRTKMGNSRYGSNTLQLNTDFQRVHDADAQACADKLERFAAYADSLKEL